MSIENKCKICNNLIGQFGDIKEKRCILHCKKDAWFEKKELLCGSSNTTTYIDWNKSSQQTKEFWQKIKEFINEQIDEILFYEIIFPKFEQINPLKILHGKMNDGTPTCIITENNLHFWEKGTVRFFDKPVTFMNCTFLGKVDFSHIIFKNAVNFRNSTFNEIIQINESQFKDQLYFCEDTKINELRIDYSTKINKLKFENTNLSNDLFIKSPEINKLEIINNKKINKIRIHDSKINSILMKSNIYINDFILKNTIIKGTVNLDLTENKEKILDNFEINGCTFNDDSFIVIKKVNFNNFLIIDNDNISGAFCLYDTTIENKIRFEYTDVSNFEFHNCNFEQVEKKIKIKNVSFISNNGFTIFNGVKWGNIAKTFDPSTDRDTFRQLKYVNEKQGNIIEANKFYSAEMKAYKEELKDKKNKHRWQERVVFWLNEKVSNFSQSWILPLAWYSVFGFLFAFIYYFNSRIFLFQGFISASILLISIVLFCNDIRELSDFKKTMKLLTIISGLNYFMNVPSESLIKLFKFINPFNTSGLDDNDGRLIWWILFRIISVFIIYQFIISLRRQTRR